MKAIILLILFQFYFIEMQAQEVNQNPLLSKSNTGAEVSKKNISLATKHYVKATKISNKGDKEGAILEYKKAIALNPNYLEACNDIAVAFLNLKDYKSSLYYFDMTLSIQPTYKLAQNNKSIALFSQGNEILNEGDNQGSIPFFQEAIDLNTNYQEAYNNIAIAYLRLENYVLALDYLDVALLLNPESKLSQNNEAYIYRELGTKKFNEEDYQGAINAYQEAININSNYFEAYNDIAIAYLKLDNYNTAIILLDKALSISPYYELTKVNKAIVYLKRGINKLESGDNKGAIADFSESIDSDPLSPEAYSKMATAFSNLGDVNNSQNYNKKAIEIKEEKVIRDEAKFYYSAGTKKYISQNYQDAIQDYTKAIGIYPKYFEAYNDRGSAHYCLREFNTAMDDYKMCLQINPSYGIAQNNIELIKQYRNNKANRVLNIIAISANTLNTTLNTINDNKSNNTSSVNSINSNSNITSNCDSNKSLYERQRMYLKDEILRLVNLKVYNHSYGELGEVFIGTEAPSTQTAALTVLSLKNVQAYQNLMRTIRVEANKRGCTITKAEEEDWRQHI